MARVEIDQDFSIDDRMKPARQCRRPLRGAYLVRMHLTISLSGITRTHYGYPPRARKERYRQYVPSQWIARGARTLRLRFDKADESRASSRIPSGVRMQLQSIAGL
jgi:hypothetical protein